MVKRRLIVSYKNLPAELREQVDLVYPTGFNNHAKKINKNDHEFFYAVNFETEDTTYLVKVDVVVDDNLDEEGINNIIRSNDEEINEEKDIFDNDFEEPESMEDDFE
jgi:hypothetical protein